MNVGIGSSQFVGTESSQNIVVHEKALNLHTRLLQLTEGFPMATVLVRADSSKISQILKIPVMIGSVKFGTC